MAKPSCCGGAPDAKEEKIRYGKLIGTVSVQSRLKAPARTSICCGAGRKHSPGQACNASSKKIQEPWVLGPIDTPAGIVPRVKTQLSIKDRLGSFKCRWNIGRMDYKVDPGLFCVGTPDDQSPVLVTANYKMTFDRVRSELGGISAWIVVLDTDGINVWCAAGKGTFGTKELVHRISATKLAKVVSHRTVIVPQLGATGIAAHEVLTQSGFKVAYGPVRAEDLKAYLHAGMVATKRMRTVKFTMLDRLVLTPMELVFAIKPLMLAFGAMFILNTIGLGQYGLADLIALLGAVITGCIAAPVLLPFLPGRAFSFKGFVLGLLFAVAINVWQGFANMQAFGFLKAAAYFLLIPSISSFLMMNFTGSSTYTSLSGVDKEMKIALPAIILSAGAGVILLLVSGFVKVTG